MAEAHSATEEDAMSEYPDGLFDISGKVAVITGGGGILCGAIARGLARRGVKVAVLDVKEDAAREVAEAIGSSGGEALPVAVDVLDVSSVRAGRDTVVGHFGTVDFLINGAGGNHPKASTSPEVDFFDLPIDAVRWVSDLNFLGTFIPCQVFGKDIAERGEGVILNVGSMNAIRPLTRVPAYSAAKAAVTNFTQWLAVHFSLNYSKKIRVNAIAPGFFLTHQNRYLLTDEKTGELTPRGKAIISHTPMDRFGNPEDLIGTVAWLLSPASAFVHGAVIPVDGGCSAYSGI
jgi:NAD(P)-dependent dehydrogenase (short-subunit alcohol dehydrogenase family)